MKKKFLKENNDHFFEDILLEYGSEYVLFNFLNDYSEYINGGGKIGTPISDSYKEKWELIDTEQLKNAYLEMSKNGYLRTYSKIVYKWFGMLERDIAQFYGNTELMGHSNSDFEIESEYFIEKWNSLADGSGYEISNNDEGYMSYWSELTFDNGETVDFGDFLAKITGNWMETSTGDIAFSDYGVDPMLKIINEYNDNTSPEECLVLINKILDVGHWNGDLAGMFVKGGTKTLIKLSNESKQKNKMLIITESQYKRLFQLNEYLDKTYGIPLLRYFQMTDEDKGDWLIHHYYKKVKEYLSNRFEEGNLPIRIMRLIHLALRDGRYNDRRQMNMFANDEDYKRSEIWFDWDKFIKVLIKDYYEIYCDLCNYMMEQYYYGNFNISDETPTWMNMQFKGIVKNQWLIHFSNNAEDIFRNGFKYGMNDIDTISYSRNAEHDNEGYSFAYLADNADVDFGDKYGDDAVMFLGSGVEAYHYGDEEYQVIFNNKLVHDFVYIFRNDEDNKWSVQHNKTNRIIFSSDEMRNVISWVEENYWQYQDVIGRR